MDTIHPIDGKAPGCTTTLPDLLVVPGFLQRLRSGKPFVLRFTAAIVQSN
jgi:hypothetical protein